MDRRGHWRIRLRYINFLTLSALWTWIRLFLGDHVSKRETQRLVCLRRWFFFSTNCSTNDKNIGRRWSRAWTSRQLQYDQYAFDCIIIVRNGSDYVFKFYLFLEHVLMCYYLIHAEWSAISSIPTSIHAIKLYVKTNRTLGVFGYILLLICTLVNPLASLQ